jgi:hypothetical protein
MTDDELIARVREALKQIPREILREPFPENPAIDEMKAIRSYSQVAAEQALDTLARRLEERKDDLRWVMGSWLDHADQADPHIPNHYCEFSYAPDAGGCSWHERWVDTAERVGLLDEWAEDDIARSLLHPEPQEGEE